MNAQPIQACRSTSPVAGDFENDHPDVKMRLHDTGMDWEGLNMDVCVYVVLEARQGNKYVVECDGRGGTVLWDDIRNARQEARIHVPILRTVNDTPENHMTRRSGEVREAQCRDVINGDMRRSYGLTEPHPYLSLGPRETPAPIDAEIVTQDGVGG